MCGDYIKTTMARRRRSGSPLHVRGLLNHLQDAMRYARITPACAGTTRHTNLQPLQDQDHPCMCGDYGEIIEEDAKAPGSPLHVRGLLFGKPKNYAFVGITPACAGTTISFLLPKEFRQDHPCMCGDYFLKLWQK